MGDFLIVLNRHEGRGEEGGGEAGEGGQEAQREEAEEGAGPAPSARPQEGLRHRRRLPVPGNILNAFHESRAEVLMSNKVSLFYSIQKSCRALHLQPIFTFILGRGHK